MICLLVEGARVDLTSRDFKSNAVHALGDANLQTALGRLETNFGPQRLAAMAALPEFEELCDVARDIKDHVIDHLDVYLECFEAKVVEAGGEVHWCQTPAEARQTVLKLCRSVGARTATKGKSMIAEEIGINDYLSKNGVVPIETDLGEYIIQLAGQPPSHIIAPAVHMTKEEISDLFFENHKKYGRTTRHVEPSELVNEARELLRHRYIEADVGITGANFLVAETGSSVIVTNEGNGDLTQTLPEMHIVIASLEKMVPTLEDVTTLLRVLARSATGQEFATYNTFSTGPKRPQDPDGPSAYHVVLLDNGRSTMPRGAFRDMLRCIRCGSCLNNCPVYTSIGGHAYGWVYPGPMGAVLTPNLIGIEDGFHLPNASSFCGRCEAVCPMRIPLPRMMRTLREQAFEAQITSVRERRTIKLWAFLAKRPALYRYATNAAAIILNALSINNSLSWLPWSSGWTSGRDLPAPQGRTFHSQWRKR